MAKDQAPNVVQPADADPNAAERKRDHIGLAFRSQIELGELDTRFYYEPLLAAHPAAGSWPAFTFLDKKFRAPLWVSSMTGGTALAHTINHNLARACGEFGLGMGLGSCRPLLYSDDNLADFAVRRLMGDEQPLFANLGIAQLEQLIEQNELYRIKNLLDKLEADGLIIHVNPLQEWLQPEGDRFQHPPLDTIKKIIDYLEAPIIVKEVGQGMGKASLGELLLLPLAAIDFAAAGGTNFAKLELLRSDAVQQDLFTQLAHVGHSAEEMVDMVNELQEELGNRIQCHQIIISGGIKNFLDGYFLMKKLNLPSIYGQASGFLKHAQADYETCRAYVATQIEGLELASAYLKVR